MSIYDNKKDEIVEFVSSETSAIIWEEENIFDHQRTVQKVSKNQNILNN